MKLFRWIKDLFCDGVTVQCEQVTSQEFLGSALKIFFNHEGDLNQEALNAFVRFAHQDPELLIILRSLNMLAVVAGPVEQSRVSPHTQEEIRFALVQNKEFNKDASEPFVLPASNVLDMIAKHRQRFVKETTTEKESDFDLGARLMKERLIGKKRYSDTYSKIYNQLDKNPNKGDPARIAELQLQYQEEPDAQERARLANEITIECRFKRENDSIKFEHDHAKSMIEDLENHHWLLISWEKKDYLSLAYALLKRMTYKEPEEETEESSEDDKPQEWEINEENMTQSSPVLNKEQLEALAETQRPRKEQYLKHVAEMEESQEIERTERKGKALEEARLSFSKLSISKLHWIPIDERLPSYTREDYLNQDSLCILLVEGVTQIWIAFGLFCPAVNLFRRYDGDEILLDDEKSYDDLSLWNKHYYEFYQKEDNCKITHWMPISRQTSPRNATTINFDMPIIDSMGNMESGIVEFKKTNELTINDLPWIHTAGRLPHDKENCLIKQSNGEIITAKYTIDGWFYDFESVYEVKTNEVTHWFPIAPEDSEDEIQRDKGAMNEK